MDKFVTCDRFDPEAAGREPRPASDHGTLYAARFDADGRGGVAAAGVRPRRSVERGGRLPRPGARWSKCRAAADRVGARHRWTGPRTSSPAPSVGRVCISCTKNGFARARPSAARSTIARSTRGVDAANPRSAERLRPRDRAGRGRRRRDRDALPLERVPARRVTRACRALRFLTRGRPVRGAPRARRYLLRGLRRRDAGQPPDRLPGQPRFDPRAPGGSSPTPNPT